MIVLIDGAHVRAAHGYQLRHVDVTVGKIEVTGKPPRRFALAPKGAESPLATLRQALRDRDGSPAVPSPPSVTGKQRFLALSVSRSASQSPTFWIGDTSPCERSTSSKRCAASMYSTLNTERDWRSSMEGLGASASDLEQLPR
jgi:hypothetical protein